MSKVIKENCCVKLSRLLGLLPQTSEKEKESPRVIYCVDLKTPISPEKTTPTSVEKPISYFTSNTVETLTNKNEAVSCKLTTFTENPTDDTIENGWVLV
jgi:hypothetical protein